MMAFSTMSSFWAPKNWETTTPTPAAIPKLMEKNKKLIEPHTPTEPSALAPTKRPTTIESTML